MSTLAIAGVQLHELDVIGTPGGVVLHVLRADDPAFDQFGEVYCSEVQPGYVKGWKLHRRMRQRLAVPVGTVRFMLEDDRLDSTTHGAVLDVTLGRPDDYRLLVIPPGIRYAFEGLGTHPSLIVNVPDLPHDPAEVERRDFSETDRLRWRAAFEGAR